MRGAGAGESVHVRLFSWTSSLDDLAQPGKTISDAEPSGHIDDGGDTLGGDQITQHDSRWRRSQFEKPYRHSFLGKVRQPERIWPKLTA